MNEDVDYWRAASPATYRRGKLDRMSVNELEHVKRGLNVRMCRTCSAGGNCALAAQLGLTLNGHCDLHMFDNSTVLLLEAIDLELVTKKMKGE